MKLKLKSALAITGWLLIAAAGIVLLAAAVSKKNQ